MPRLYSVEEAKALPDAEMYELVDGVLKERDMGAIASLIEAWAQELLTGYARQSGLFWPFSPSVALHIFEERPRYFRRADSTLVARSRFAGQLPQARDLYLVPDFVLEVVSPTDLAAEVDEKIRDYLAAGVRMTWVIYPDTRTVMVYRPGEAALRLVEGEKLPGFDVLPGFDHMVDDLFPR